MQEWDEKYLKYDCALVDCNNLVSGSANDVDTVTLLRLLGYKMVIACMQPSVSNSEEVGLKNFNFCFNSKNSSKIGVRQLEDVCHTLAISHLCWLDGLE